MHILLRSITGILSLLACQSAVLGAEPPPLDLAKINGNYEEVSPRCIEKSGTVLDKCSTAFRDRMVIEQLSVDNARVIVHSYQENQHQCHADGVAKIIENKLRYCLDYEPGTCLVVAQEANKLTLSVILEGTAYVPFCGSRANLDGLEFPLASKIDGVRCLRNIHH